jgi:hypothetical protein
MAVSTNVSAPWSWPASTFWDGNDGLWNSFVVQVGTPAQEFRVLPSILEQGVWVPHPDGCTPDDPADCAYTRGTLPFHGANSTGLQINESSTWEAIGLYTLSLYGESMGYPGNGLFGRDTIALSNESDALELPQQVVAAIADKSFYLGQFGLGPKPSNFTTFNEPIPNYMVTLANKSMIPSISFGYTAGAHYRDKAPASLTLGGYDDNRFEASELSHRMNADNTRPLQVGVQKILAENTLRGSVNLLPTGIFQLVDSTVPHIWLPDNAIDEFVSAFGLIYDNTTELYLVNDTIHEELLQKQPTITFVIGNNTKDGMGPTQNIELPYAAFDLQAGYPFYVNDTARYFPIRRAANESQYTIGRTFLQEAYVIVDWERQNFTVAQARFDSLTEEKLVPILSKANDPSSNQTQPVEDKPESQDSALSPGAIAGIVVGIVVLLALIGAAGFFYFRKKKYQKVVAAKEDGAHADSSMQKSPFQRSEVELQSVHVSEMPSEHVVAEAEGVAKFGRFTLQEAPTAPIGQMHGMSELGHGDSFRAEAPGPERDGRYELPGNDTQER